APTRATEAPQSPQTAEFCTTPSFGSLQQLASGTFCDAALELGAEMAHQPLDRPGGSVAERANGVSLDLLGDVEKLVDVLDLGIALAKPLHHPPHPAGALTTGRALAAALVLVEIADAADRTNDVGRLVHYDDCGGAEAGAECLQAVEIHRSIEDLLGRNQRDR